MKIIYFTILSFILCSCASSPHRMPSGEKIPEGVDTVVLASNKSVNEFYIELKKRAVKRGYHFVQTDKDTHLFVTEFEDTNKRTSVQFKVYIKGVKGGSNAVYSGKYIDLKKLKNKPHTRAQKIVYPGKGKAGRAGWEALHSFAVGAKKYKYTFTKRQ